jgi:hypothetical protein
VIARANTTIEILRGTTTDTYGDQQQDDYPVQRDIAVSLIEENQTTTRRADNRPQTMRFFRTRVPPTVDVRVGDRIRDKGGVVYVVDEITVPTSPFGTPSQRLRLRRAT